MSAKRQKRVSLVSVYHIKLDFVLILETSQTVLTEQ